MQSSEAQCADDDVERRHALNDPTQNPDEGRHCRFCWAQLEEGRDEYVSPCDCKGSMVRAWRSEDLSTLRDSWVLTGSPAVPSHHALDASYIFPHTSIHLRIVTQ